MEGDMTMRTVTRSEYGLTLFYYYDNYIDINSSDMWITMWISV